ncbi:unnamed protein product [Rotaria sp. Silwood1]|nr:unnamed protein product [Rotaria sp. Silwood1]CAF0906022.1 unnamed protein product [Rotaria sp. Silwood1]CAF3392016.1 unnamed protein product [Rotaria sp. Silwood1]CAF4678426.1 unnamed protein product [Rotaria sp. Silwood1]
MVHWRDTFWGEGNRGFEVLSTNVKNSGIAIEEFQRFLNENLQYESTYCKNLSRLQAQLLKFQHVGTFTPIWHSIRDLLEKIALAHSTTVTYYQDLLREIHNYHDSYLKKVKTSIQKDPDIARTADLISQLNNALNTVNKAKEQYHSIGLDYERTKRSGNNLTNGSSTPVPQDNNTTSSLAQTALNTLTSSTRQFERLEKKFRQSHDDYKASIEKYNSLRNEFEKRFYDACTKFQDFEGEHVEKMLAFSLNYSEILKRNNEQTGVAQNEFIEKIKQFTGNDLIEAFVEHKKTGVERPVPVQFEEIDNIRTSLNLTNSTNPTSSLTPDSAGYPSDELIIFDSPETTNVPSFQAHFPVSSPIISSGCPSTTNMKKSDSNRALASTSSLGHQYVPHNNQTMSPIFNNPPMSLSNPNNPLARLQETSNEQTSNPFDVKIRRPAFKGFWPSNRKEKKEKKADKKTSNNSKLTKTAQLQQQHDETGSVNSQNSAFETNDINKMMGSMDGLDQISSTRTKSKCPTPEPYTQSSPTIPNNSINRPVCQSTIPFSTSTLRKSTSSSVSSDEDDDDFPISKIQFKINPTTQKTPIAEENDETNIMNVMRVVDKNIGHFATYSRAAGRKAPDMSKSTSSGQIGTKIPPPLPSRQTPSMSTSVTTDNIDQSSTFPLSSPHTSLTNTFDEFEARSKSMTVSSSHQENIPPAPVHPRSMTLDAESKKPTSIPLTDDDTEVANSFPVDSPTNKTAPFVIPRPPRTRQPLHNNFSSFHHSSENNLSIIQPYEYKITVKKSKSDLINLKSNIIFQEKYSTKKILKIRLSIITCIRSIWKISTKRTPIIFRKLYPLSIRHKIPITTKTSFGFSTNQTEEIMTNNLTKQLSIYSFHTARESLSDISLNDTESIHSLHSISMNNITLKINDNRPSKFLPHLIPPSNVKLWSRTRTHSDEQQQPTISSVGPSIANGRMTPFTGPNNQSLSNSLMASIDQRISPLTIGASDQIPIAVAFQETIHVMMSGDDQTKWKIRILGDMLVSFPAAILNLLVNPSPILNTLEFRLQNLNKVENIIANPQLITSNQSSVDSSDGPTYSFNMSALSNILRNLQEKNRSLPFFNFGILKYEVKHTGISNIPIQVSSQWTRTFDTISININYRFNSSALPESIRLVNDVVTFYTTITDGQQINQSIPMAEWSLTEHKLSWKIPYIFDGSGTLTATITTVQSTTDNSDNDQQQKPLTASSIVHVQFLAENALFSSINFEFACRGYRVSLFKKKICSGKYQSEPDQSEPLNFFKRPSVDQNRMSLSTSLVA